MTIPKGYKQTELGIIPDDWEVKTFGELGSFSKGSGISRAESNTGNIPCVRYGEIYTHHNDYIKKYNSFISSEVAKKAKLLHCGDILFAGSGETKEDIGKSIAFIENIEAYAGGDIIILSTSANICDAKFIGYVSNTSFVNKQKTTKGQGDAVVHITSDSLKNILIPLPPLSEQQSIAEALSDVDNLIAALDKKIAKKRLIKQGAMQQLLTGKKRLPGFNEEWVEKNYGRLFTHISTRNHQIDSSKYQITGKYPIVDQGQISIVGYTDNIEPIICKQDGAIIFGDHTRIFKYVDYNFCVGADGTQVLFCKDDICTKFIYYLCNILEIPNTGYNRHYKYVKEMIYNIPKSSKEQQAIATILSDMDKEITELETQRDKYRLIKSGMMQKLLTGEIRLRKE